MRGSANVLMLILMMVFIAQPFVNIPLLLAADDITDAPSLAMAEEEVVANGLESSEKGDLMERDSIRDGEALADAVNEEELGAKKDEFEDIGDGGGVGVDDGGDGDEGGDEGGQGEHEGFGEGADEEGDDEIEGLDEETSYGNFSESDVLLLTGSNFESARSEKPHMLVLFFSPDGGASKIFRPDFAKAATMHKERASTAMAVFARIDVTTDGQIGESFGVDSEPALVWFDHGAVKEYTGGITPEDMVKWVKKKSEPPAKTINSKEEMVAFLKGHAQAAVGFFEALEGKEWQYFVDLAANEDVLVFGQTTNAEAAMVANITAKAPPALVILKSEDEKWVPFDGEFDYDNLFKFIQGNKLPLVITFATETSDSVFQSPIQKQMLLFVSEKEAHKYVPILKEACVILKGDVLCIYVDADNAEFEHVLAYFDAEPNQTKVYGYAAGAAVEKVRFDGEMTAEELAAFGKTLLEAEASPELQTTSEPIPENDEDGYVKVVVGKTFDEIVLDESKDVLLEGYAPWCGHCKELEPLYSELAARLRHVESVVIAKIDATANEHQRLQTLGYPTLLFFKAGKKSKPPVLFEGQRTLEGLLAFVEKEAAIPFTLLNNETNMTTMMDAESTQSFHGDRSSSEQCKPRDPVNKDENEVPPEIVESDPEAEAEAEAEAIPSRPVDENELDVSDGGLLSNLPKQPIRQVGADEASFATSESCLVSDSDDVESDHECKDGVGKAECAEEVSKQREGEEVNVAKHSEEECHEEKEERVSITGEKTILPAAGKTSTEAHHCSINHLKA